MGPRKTGNAIVSLFLNWKYSRSSDVHHSIHGNLALFGKFPNELDLCG